MRVHTQQVTIANGQSLSGASSIAGLGDEWGLVGIQMSGVWTAAGLTFQGSATGETFGNLYATGGEVAVVTGSVGANNLVVLNPADFYGCTYVKVRSGTSAAAVAQGADRVITLVYRPLFAS